MQTCPCNEYPLIPLFYIVKLGSTGEYLFYLIMSKAVLAGAVLKCTHNLCFELKIKKI